jgi:hypothetical protein
MHSFQIYSRQGNQRTINKNQTFVCQLVAWVRQKIEYLPKLDNVYSRSLLLKAAVYGILTISGTKPLLFGLW